MHYLLLLAADPPGDGAPGWASFLPLILMAVAFYFIIMMPMRRQEKQRQALIAAVKKNDKVITSGGLIGIVASVNSKEDEVTLKVDESANVRLKVTRSSIVRVISAEESKKEKEDESKEEKEGAE